MLLRAVPAVLTACPLFPRRCDVYSPDEGTMAMSNHGVPAEEGAPGFPALPEGKRVGVLMIHGGAWMLGEKEQLEMWARGMAKKGYVCVLNGYRLALPPDQRTAIALANGMDEGTLVSYTPPKLFTCCQRHMHAPQPRPRRLSWS
eukprot:COSAG04_NODE_3994_length_2368_cov_6.032556_4_plen_144_part_01